MTAFGRPPASGVPADAFTPARFDDAGPVALRKMLASQRPGQCACDALRQCVECDDMILQYAAKHRLPVRLLCGSLAATVRETLWRDVTGVTFADRLVQILNHRVPVEMFVWDVLSPERLAPSILDLVPRYASTGPGDGLRLYASGTREAGGELVHFLLAGDPYDARAVLRVETEHAPFEPVTQPSATASQDCAVLHATPDCAEKGRILVAIFDELTSALRQ